MSHVVRTTSAALVANANHRIALNAVNHNALRINTGIACRPWFTAFHIASPTPTFASGNVIGPTNFGDPKGSNGSLFHYQRFTLAMTADLAMLWERDSRSRKFAGISVTNPFVCDEFLLPQSPECAG
jgi:hypothetical protein